MNNEYFMGGPMPYRGGGYMPSYLSTQAAPNNANTNIVWTMGLESAKAYPLYPGRTLMLMDSESPRFFIKTVDNNGYATLKAYTFQEEAIATPMPTNSSGSEFVTKEQLSAAVDGLLEEIKKLVTTTTSTEVEVEKTTTKNLL